MWRVEKKREGSLRLSDPSAEGDREGPGFTREMM